MRRVGSCWLPAALLGVACDAGVGVLPSRAEPPAAPWTHVIDGAAHGHDRALDVEVDPANDVVAAGYVSGADRADDLWLIKLDAQGERVWSVLDETGPDMGAAASGIGIDGDGNIAVAGSFFTTEDEGWDVLVRSYDADGELRWEHVHAGIGHVDDQGVGAAAHPDGRVVVVGFEGQAELMRKPDIDAWIAAFDADGTLAWTDLHDGPASGIDAALDVAIADDGDVVVAGYETTAERDSDIWIRRYDAGGDELWTVTHDGPEHGFDRGTSVAVTPDGGIVVTGHVCVAGQAWDAWVGRYDADGELIWVRTHDGEASVFDAANDVAVDDDGAIVVTGYEFVDGEALDVWVRKYDADGEEIWTHTHGGPARGDDQGAGVAIDADGFVYVAGSEFQRRLDFEPEDCEEDLLTDSGECPPIIDTDAWLRKLPP